ncbi:MAG: calcium-binding EGF-like domain-containing protein [Bacteroidota bacterium]
MKKILIIALTSCSLLLFDGCKKKKAEEPAADPCANTVCLNGGTCVDGSCSCPTGYSGADCGTQKTPTKVTITGIKVVKFPALSGTSDWDPYPGYTNPDIFAVVKQGGTTLITTSAISDVPANSVNVLTVSPYNVTDLLTQLNIELFDDDTSPDADDSMGAINFPVYTSGDHFPTTLTVDNGAGTLTFELTLSYTY